MRTVELVRGIHSSALGFGCAPVMGSIDARKSYRAIECAIDCGINHFDLARSYGYGDAEEFIGEIINKRRDKVILASKFGIKANWKAKLLRTAKPLVRLAKEKIKRPEHNEGKVIAPVNAISDRFLYRIPLNGKEMKRSFEQSLRALKTDYLDYIFIHEPLESLENFEELTAMYELLKEQGKVRAWGLAYFRSQESFHKPYLDRFDVLQFDNSPGSEGYKSSVEQRGIKSNIIFSPMKNGYKDMKPADKLSKLFYDFPNSVILCSMFNEQHIKQNAGLVGNNIFKAG